MDLEFQSRQSFNKLKNILISVRDKTLADLTRLPATEVYRYRFMNNYIKELDRIIDGKSIRMPDGRIKIEVKPLEDRLSDEIPMVKVYEKSFQEGYQELGIHKGFPLIDKQALAFLEDYKFENIKKISEKIRGDIKSQLRLGIIQGKGVTEIAKRIRNQHSIITDRTQRIVRTELARAQFEGHFKSYQELNVTRIEIIGRGVDCPICGQHIGKIYRIDMAPHVPLHPNCQCDGVPVERGEGNWIVTERMLDFVQEYELPENLSISRTAINRIRDQHPESLFVWRNAPEVINKGSFKENTYSMRYSKPLIKNLRKFNIQTKATAIQDAWLEK